MALIQSSDALISNIYFNFIIYLCTYPIHFMLIHYISSTYVRYISHLIFCISHISLVLNILSFVFHISSKPPENANHLTPQVWLALRTCIPHHSASSCCPHFSSHLSLPWSPCQWPLPPLPLWCPCPKHQPCLRSCLVS